MGASGLLQPGYIFCRSHCLGSNLLRAFQPSVSITLGRCPDDFSRVVGWLFPHVCQYPSVSSLHVYSRELEETHVVAELLMFTHCREDLSQMEMSGTAGMVETLSSRAGTPLEEQHPGF